MNATGKGLMLLNLKKIYFSKREKHVAYLQTMAPNDP